ncbi:AAA-like domain-containing protein [Gloeothece verrucosa]|uniref:HTH cro/C1-type domain-containing protein n=1 Tax=Gloeothece verrucosa (strain PCC 7822) TaxID=497965 RepID=E0U7W2_GLOV7|nr:AAA-like domain-containing protein [Gloeothece verrucosa]ADN16049.1 conserved hypothetical protein [Gloeothece verrucosa PCC 7822]
MERAKTKRKRGVILTSAGLKRLQAAILAVEIAENHGQRFTLEELSARINISPKTLSRLWSLKASVDHRTLKLCFSAFNLELESADYNISSDLDKISTDDLIWGNSLDEQDIDFFESRREHSFSVKESDNLTYTVSFPDGPIAFDSPLYIERPPIEKLAYQEINQRGCVLRIRAPKEMGKSSLVVRLLALAKQQHYYTVKLNCNQIDYNHLTDLNKFLRCFCNGVAKELGIEPKLDDNWDEEIGSKLSCTFYFKNYLLKQINHPLILVLEEVDCLFEYPQLAQEFFPLLRSWYEEARRDTDWQKLRLIVVYSTEAYISIDLNRSPFNVGLPLRLPEFTRQQIQELAKRYGLDWYSTQEASQLMSVVGGHPLLIQITLYYICSQQIPLNNILQEALVNGGIYRYHLWRHWVKLQENPSLLEAYAKVVRAQTSISLNPLETYKLESLGLITYKGNNVIPSCELYRNYFLRQLSKN